MFLARVEPQYQSGPDQEIAGDCPPGLPAYLVEYYSWAYIHPTALRIFDRNWVVSTILWGQYGRLKRACFREFHVGQRVLQAACVYGDFSAGLARRVGPQGALDVVDIVPLQVEYCRKKLEDIPWAEARLANAHLPDGGAHDAVCCFFLLHELPDCEKTQVVDALLDAVGAGGKVVFVDYHRPRWWHPIKPVTALVFRLLEPFARVMWDIEIRGLASRAGAFSWRKQTLFGGLFQVVTAEHLD